MSDADPAGRELDRQAWQARLSETPWAFDFYQVMRRIEGWYPGSARIGESRRLGEDAVRLGQVASMTFAPANVERVSITRSGKVRISVRFLGLFGPQGPLPAHLTDVAYSREHNFRDETFARFADVFHHRQLSLFYRGWRQAQPTANRDRPGEDRFMTYLGALIGEAGQAWRRRDALGDPVKRHYAGILSRGARNAGGLVAILGSFFEVPVALVPYAARWMTLPEDQRTRLGAAAECGALVSAPAGATSDASAGGVRGASGGLGQGAVIGRRVFDAQHHIQLRIGPLTFGQFEHFLPGGEWHPALVDWVRRYGDEVWVVGATLRLAADQVPAVRLGQTGRLGWTSWLGTRQAKTSADDLSLTVSMPAG